MRALVRYLPLLALATTLSCADMPTAPREVLTVTGQITDRDGPGISQTYVDFISLDPRDRAQDGEGPIVIASPRGTALDASTVTDTEGRYRIQIPAGPYRVIVQRQTGYPPVVIPRFEAAPGRSELNYHYTGVRITGTLTVPAGVSLTGAQVVVNRRSGLYEGWWSVYATMVGSQYSMLVPPGSYELSAGAHGTVGLPAVSRNITVASDTTVDVELTGHLLTGTVRGPNGLPLERIRITARGAPDVLLITTYSTADGSYRMYVPEGVYRFELAPWDASAKYIASRDYPPVPVTGPAVLDFDMSGVEWSGTVKNSSDSTTVSDAYVSVQELGDPYRFGATVWTDASGTFRLVVRPDQYYVLATYNRVVGTFASHADTTFTIYVDPSPLP